MWWLLPESRPSGKRTESLHCLVAYPLCGLTWVHDGHGQTTAWCWAISVLEEGSSSWCSSAPTKNMLQVQILRCHPRYTGTTILGEVSRNFWVLMLLKYEQIILWEHPPPPPHHTQKSSLYFLQEGSRKVLAWSALILWTWSLCILPVLLKRRKRRRWVMSK